MYSEEEEFQFEYESDEESEPVSFQTIPAAAACSTDPPLQDVEIENQYYNAKGQRADNPEEALSGFSIVVSMQDEKGEWGFKALASMVWALQHLAKSYLGLVAVSFTIIVFNWPLPLDTINLLSGPPPLDAIKLIHYSCKKCRHKIN